MSIFKNKKNERNRYFNEGWFGRHPGVYEFASFFISPIRKLAVKKMGIKKLKIIDIATGTGAHALELAKLKHNVTGIDIDKKMLAKANNKISHKLKLKFMYGDGTNIPSKENEFDAATISFAMHDVPYDIGIRILKEAKRVVKNTGFIFIVDYNDLSNIGSRILNFFARIYESPNYKPFVNVGLKSYLKKTGWKIEEKSTFLGAIQFVKICSI